MGEENFLKLFLEKRGRGGPVILPSIVWANIFCFLDFSHVFFLF